MREPWEDVTRNPRPQRGKLCQPLTSPRISLANSFYSTGDRFPVSDGELATTENQQRCEQHRPNPKQPDQQKKRCTTLATDEEKRIDGEPRHAKQPNCGRSESV